MNTKIVLVVAPHADDESLGCAGTLLKHIDNGFEVHWLLVTSMSVSAGYSKGQIKRRNLEIKKVAALYKFSGIHELRLAPAKLDTLPKGDIIAGIKDIVNKIQPSIIYTVYRSDVHSDHEIVFDAVISATKSFRCPMLKRLLAYETISETDFGLKPEDGGFRPNVFVDIEKYLVKKLEILDVFESEIHEFPFPRSRRAITALANLRGVQSNSMAAEAFMLLKEIQ